MNGIIKELKNVALSGSDIYNACEKNIKVLKYGQLLKFKNIDDAFNPYNAISLLYELKNNYGHWVLLLRHQKNNTIEFFDSYGMFIDDQLKHVSDEFRNNSGQKFIYLSKLLADSKYKIIYNSVKIQEKKNGVSSCGRHLCLRYLLRDMPLDQYVKILKSDKCNNSDDIVTYLTAFV